MTSYWLPPLDDQSLASKSARARLQKQTQFPYLITDAEGDERRHKVVRNIRERMRNIKDGDKFHYYQDSSYGSDDDLNVLVSHYLGFPRISHLPSTKKTSCSCCTERNEENKHRHQASKEIHLSPPQPSFMHTISSHADSPHVSDISKMEKTFYTDDKNRWLTYSKFCKLDSEMQKTEDELHRNLRNAREQLESSLQRLENLTSTFSSHAPRSNKDPKG